MSGINTNYTNNGFNYPIQDNKEPIDESKVSGLGINEEITKLKKELEKLQENIDNLNQEINILMNIYKRGGNLSVYNSIINQGEKLYQLNLQKVDLESKINELEGKTYRQSTTNNPNSASSQDTNPLTGLFSLIKEQTQSS